MDAAPSNSVDMYFGVEAPSGDELIADLTDSFDELDLRHNGGFQSAFANFDASQDRVWRLTLDENTPLLELSADGATFHNAASLAQQDNGALVSSIAGNAVIEVSHGAFGGVNNPALAGRIMSISVFPSLTCAVQCAPARIDLRTAADIQPPFAPFNEAGVVVDVNRGETINVPASSTAFGGIISSVSRDLRGVVLDVRFVDVEPTTHDLQVFMGALDPANTDFGIKLETSGAGDGFLFLDFDPSDGQNALSQRSSSAYDVAGDRIFRLVFGASTVRALTSADGQTFVDRGMALTDARLGPFLESAVIGLGAGNLGNAPATTITLASITIWPSAACAP
jgi:hypothetical protein